MIRRTTSEETLERELRHAIERVAERAQPYYEHPLEVWLGENPPGEYLPGAFNRAFFLVEEVPGRFLWIFPTIKPRNLLLVAIGFWGMGRGEKLQHCRLRDGKIADLVAEELGNFVQTYDATLVLEEDYQ